MAPFGTASVAIATTPTVVSTFFSHLLSKPSRRSEAKKSLASGGPGGGPENDLSYEEGLKLVRRFLDFSSHRGVEEVQAFTAMQVPTPHWVRREVVVIPDDTIEKAATILGRHLGSYGGGKGIELVGGERWWQVRGKQLEAEWIEMQKDYLRRKARRQNTSSTTVNSPTDADDSREANGTAPPKAASTRKSGWFGGGSGSIKDGSGHEVQEERVILYIHGKSRGAFFFSSLDTHRYQVQRHARKAGARAFSPAYRLAPQYPFPCGLLDSLAAYLYLLTPPPDATHAPVSPTDIIFMGDSAGAGMCISLLVLIREMGLPMPAGASLISPWVDLTHSMPSISGSDLGDFIPSSGFHYRPSATWPPLPGDGITSLSVEGTEEHYDNQVQMYCANNLLSHPLISPVNQGSLGGLCPLLIIGGGGELLRDEIIYLANKAANPTLYSPSSRTLSDYPEQAALIDKYKPTRVHLQVYEGCCHVVPTLSWTSSAKYMYRACANFNIWAYTAAAKGLEMRFAKKEKAHRHGHEHKHKRRQHSEGESGTESETVSRSSTLGSASGQGSRKGSGEMPSLARLAMTTNDAAAATITDSPITPTSAGSTGTPAFNSTDPSLVDLTQPLISSSAAAFANKEGVCEEDVQSECSSSECSSAEDEEGAERADDQDSTIKPSGIVSVTGTEPIPLAGTHIVSERVSTRGRIRPFEPVHQVPALHPDLKEHIGQVHPEGAIKKWMAKRAEWDEKYRKDLDRWWAVKRADRERAEAAGYLTRDLGVGSGGTKERPPLSALAGWYDREMAREVGKSVDEAQGKMGMGAMLWMRAGGKADKEQAGGETMEEIKQTVQQELQESAQSGSSTDVQSQDNTGASGTSRAAGGTATARGRRRSSVARPASAGLTGRARADTIRSAQVHVQMAEERAKGDAIAPQEKAEEQRINRA